MNKLSCYCKAIFLIMLMLSAFGLEAQQKSHWLTNFAEARKLAEKQDKIILINFSGSDWCGWCIKLEREVFAKKVFKDYASKKLILLLLDFPQGKEQPKWQRQQNQQLARKYRIRGFPSILLINASGQVIARTGYRFGGAKAYVTHLQKLITAYYKSQNK